MMSPRDLAALLKVSRVSRDGFVAGKAAALQKAVDGMSANHTSAGGNWPQTGFEAISLQLNAILTAAWEAASMARRKKSKRSKAKTILRLPDLEQSKYAVLHSLGAASSQESYGHAIDEFIAGTVPKFRLNRRPEHCG